MKKKLLIALGIVLLFIPTYIAITFYAVAQNAPVSKGVVYKMEMADIDGNLYTFDSESKKTDSENPAEKKPIDFFIELNDHASSIEELPEPLTDAPCYIVTYYSYNLKTTYKYYFTADPTDAYYTDNKGNAYQIKVDDASDFVTSKFAVPLYKDAAAPNMTVSGNTVLPKSMKWNYKLSNGQYSEAVVSLSDSDNTEYRVSGSINLAFDTKPDTVNVKVLQGDSFIFNDSYESLSTLSFTETARLTVVVNATWFENEERGSYGEAEYRFIADVRAPAEFYLGATTIAPGEFVVITGKNVADPSEIEFTSEPSINFTPTFFAEGENVIALVPLALDLDYSPSYTFTLTVDGNTSQLTLGCEDKKFLWRDYNISAEIIAYTRTEATINDFNETLSGIFADSLDKRYWKDNQALTRPCVNDRQVKVGIGIHRTLTATGLTYRHEGVDFMVRDNDQVYSVAPGKVVYVGTLSLSGRTVIVDHGFGLKTLYAHLSSNAVAEGDFVEAGSIIGVVGATGFTAGVNLHFGTYVFDVPVSPYDMLGWENNGIQMHKP